MAPVNSDDIQEDFDVYGIVINGSDELEKCIDLCKTYNLTSEQVAVRWLGFAASKGYDEVTCERLESLEKEIKQDKSLSKEEDLVSNENINTTNARCNEDDDEDLALLANFYGASEPPAMPKTSNTNNKNNQLMHTPPCKNKATLSQNSPCIVPSLSHLNDNEKYFQRSNRGKVVCSFGDPIIEPRKETNKLKPLIEKLKCHHELSKSYTFMFEKLRDCGEILDDLIYQLAIQMKEEIGVEEFSALRILSNESVWCVGRICCDGVGRMNAASVLLEGSREHCHGPPIKLDVSKLLKYSLFPGQIVAVKAINSTGNCLIAQEIVTGKILETSSKPLSLGDTSLEVRVVSGPLTTKDNLNFEPLLDYLEILKKDPPHVLLILGPILEANHPALNDSSLTDSYDTIMERCLQAIETAIERTDTQVYVVMSQSDICSIPIYPTPPEFLSSSLNRGTNDNIHLLPDPCLLDINGVVFGATAIDYPMQMSREEISSGTNGDRMTRLSQHILLQQSFCPVFPPPEDINVNIEKLELYAKLPVTPHVMITPSDLKGFIKETDNCVFINPERLAKGSVGGSHCIVSVNEGNKDGKPNINAVVLKI